MCFARIQAASLSYCLYFFECLIFWWVSLALQLMIYRCCSSCLGGDLCDSSPMVLPCIMRVHLASYDDSCLAVRTSFMRLHTMHVYIFMTERFSSFARVWIIHLAKSMLYLESFLVIIIFIWYTSVLAVASFYADLLYQPRCFHFQLSCGANFVTRSSCHHMCSYRLISDSVGVFCSYPIGKLILLSIFLRVFDTLVG